MFSADEIERLSQEFESKTPQEVIHWAVDSFWPQIALSSSFQTQSIPLLHMASLIRRDILIFFPDTGYHFWVTAMFREHLVLGQSKTGGQLARYVARRSLQLNLGGVLASH